MTSLVNEIEYVMDEKGTILLPLGAPFDGKPCLIKLASGWCEARWYAGYAIHDHNGSDWNGWCWVCMDDDFQAELDDPMCWAPLPI